MDEIIIDGVVGSWEINSQDFTNELNSKSSNVLIKVNSVGGSVVHGIAIHNAMKAYTKGLITVRIVGVAASIASYFILAADKVEAYDNTTLMIHNASLPVMGDARALRKGAEIADGLSSIIAKAYISKTGKSEKEIKALMDEETFFYGAEMLDAGFIDEIISTEQGASNRMEAVALAVENLKACNNAIHQHESDLSFEAVAKLLPQKEVVIIEKVVDLSAQQQRARALEILNKEIVC